MTFEGPFQLKLFCDSMTWELGRFWQWEEVGSRCNRGSSHFFLFQEKCLCPLISTTPKYPLSVTWNSPLHIWLSKESSQLSAHICQRFIPSTYSHPSAASVSWVVSAQQIQSWCWLVASQSCGNSCRLIWALTIVSISKLKLWCPCELLNLPPEHPPPHLHYLAPEERTGTVWEWGGEDGRAGWLLLGALLVTPVDMQTGSEISVQHYWVFLINNLSDFFFF